MSGVALFGKLPAHGDFIARGVTAPHRERIDTWLSASLADARAQLGDTFADQFDRALPWHCSGGAMGGAIAASQDSLGRRFPVLLMTAEPDAAQRCEELLYTAIGEQWEADRLIAEAGDPAGAVSIDGADRWWSSDGLTRLVGLLSARLAGGDARRTGVAMTGGFRIDSVAGTHPGLVRRVNEDSFCDRATDGLWVVADGMGGHAHGDWASSAVIQALQSVELAEDFDAAAQSVAAAIHSANRRIWSESQRRGQQMGSTVVALLIRDRRFAIVWVGDSRGYLLRGRALHLLSRDHTQVQEMVDRGLIAAADARHHPGNHVLARAIGVGERMAVDVVTDEVEPGDLFLLCSDGLTGKVEDSELAAILGTGERQATLDALIAVTLERGAPDNVTAILIGVRETTMLALAGGPDTLP